MEVRPLALAFLLSACSAPAGTSDPAPADHEVAFEGLSLHYRAAGAGPRTLVLVHGWGGSADVWEENLDDLAAFARVLALDLPGHGASDAPRIDYTVGMLARSLAAVMDDAGCDRAVLVGHSNGGAVVQQFQRLHPDRCAGLVFVESPLKAFFSREDATRMAEPLLGPDGSRAAERMVDGVVASVSAAHKDRIREIALATPLQVLYSTMVEGADSSLWAPTTIPVPVLTIYARAPFWDEPYEALVRQRCPDLDYRMWDGVGHFLMLDRPEAFSAAVEELLERVDTRR